MRRGGHHQAGDEFFAAGLRALRDLQRPAFQPRDAGYRVPWPEHLAGVGTQRRRGHRVLRRLPADSASAGSAPGHRPRLPPSGSDQSHLERRRSAARQAGDSPALGPEGTTHLVRSARETKPVSPRRTHHRPAHGRRPPAGGSVAATRRCRPHGDRYRTQPRFDRRSRLDHRPGPRRRRRRRTNRRRRDTRRGRRSQTLAHRPLLASARDTGSQFPTWRTTPAKDAVINQRSDGVMERWSLAISATPLLHYSITPTFPYALPASMSEPYEEIVDGQTLKRLAPNARHEQICFRLHESVT